MNEKWEARWEQLSMCEYSLGAREPGGAGLGDITTAQHRAPAAHSSGKLYRQGPQGAPQKTRTAGTSQPAPDLSAPIPPPHARLRSLKSVARRGVRVRL